MWFHRVLKTWSIYYIFLDIIPESIFYSWSENFCCCLCMFYSYQMSCKYQVAKNENSFFDSSLILPIFSKHSWHYHIIIPSIPNIFAFYWMMSFKLDKSTIHNRNQSEWDFYSSINKEYHCLSSRIIWKSW